MFDSDIDTDFVFDQDSGDHNILLNSLYLYKIQLAHYSLERILTLNIFRILIWSLKILESCCPYISVIVLLCFDKIKKVIILIFYFI